MNTSQGKVWKFRVTGASLAIAAIAVALYWYLRESPSGIVVEAAHVSEGAPVIVDEGTKSPREEQSMRTEGNPQPWKSLAPLPDPSVPLAGQLPILLKRAEAGDPTAACRLILSVNRCSEEARNRNFSEKMRRSLEGRAGKNDNVAIEFIARSEHQGARGGGYCSGVNLGAVPRLEDLFRKAQYSLSARQKTILALMRSDGSLRQLHDSVSFTDSGLYVMPQFIADHAVEFLT